MAAVPEDVQALFDEQTQANSDTTSEASIDNGSQNRDYHQENFPAYEPPHRRGHNVQQDKFVNFKKENDPDMVQGVDNIKYQKLKLPVPFALNRDKLNKLKAAFPGVYFHLKDNGNHDHQFSHVVTMIGTRMLQRRLPAGSRTLDVYGNANACDRFNRTQTSANKPKSMQALHLRVGPSDFIREVNKWGPFLDDEGDQRYHRGTLGDMTASGALAEFDRLQFIHTLYYQDFTELTAALHAPMTRTGKRVAYALIHRHDGDKGFINDDEQSFVKKVAINGTPLVKQTNIITRSEYVHKDLTPLLFRADKTWFPNADSKEGITWECHMVNEETWIIEIVPYVLHKLREDVTDYGAMWDMEEDDYMSIACNTPPSSCDVVTFQDDCVTIPTSDGGFIKAEIVNRKLFNTLRQACVGKERNRAQLDELVRLAKHHVSPSSMFGDKEGMRCPEEKLFDHVLAAYFVDLDRESKMMEAAVNLRPILAKHTSNLKLGPKFKDYSVSDLLGLLRCTTVAARQVNSVLRHKDPIDRGFELIGEQLS